MTREPRPAAYGGEGFEARTTTLAQELGCLWADCGIEDEWSDLSEVLLHRPGDELLLPCDANRALMLQAPDPIRAREQHTGLCAAYRAAGVDVHLVEPDVPVPPNTMFAADLFCMTPEGAILGRPASAMRAGEERHVARRLAALGVPILHSVRGLGTFEGADLIWLGNRRALVGIGLRTNQEGARQVEAVLAELGISCVAIALPDQTMHLMGQLRFLGPDRALGWPGRLPPETVEVLVARGFQILWMPDEQELLRGMALNLVTLGPGRVLMPAGNPVSQEFLEGFGVECATIEVDELARAAGGIGCLTGVLRRKPPAS